MYLITGHCKLKIRKNNNKSANYVPFLGMTLINMPKNKYNFFSFLLQTIQQFRS